MTNQIVNFRLRGIIWDYDRLNHKLVHEFFISVVFKRLQSNCTVHKLNSVRGEHKPAGCHFFAIMILILTP